MKLNNNIKAYLILYILGPVGYVVNLLAHNNPNFTNSIYSLKIYPILSSVLSGFYNGFPFSIAEISVYLLVLIFLFTFLFIAKSLFQKKTRLGSVIITFVCVILAVTSVIYFCFIAFCGLNYARPSYIELLGYDQKEYSKEELEQMAFWLAKECNTTKNNINTSASVEGRHTLVNSYLEEASKIYSEFENPSNIIKGGSNKPKPVYSSKLMSHANITGIYFPFTFESNINTDIPTIRIPSTILHEISHYKGFMRESDANFVAYVVGVESDSPHFIYSCNLMALGYTLNAYYSVATPEEYSNLVHSLSADVIQDIKENSLYWQDFQTPISDVSEKINDSYLKSNKQISGTKSYGEMVDSLLVYYYEKINITK